MSSTSTPTRSIVDGIIHKFSKAVLVITESIDAESKKGHKGWTQVLIFLCLLLLRDFPADLNQQEELFPFNAETGSKI